MFFFTNSLLQKSWMQQLSGVVIRMYCFCMFLLVFWDPKWKELIWQNVISELVMCIKMSGFGVQPTIFVFLHAQVDNYYKGTR